MRISAFIALFLPFLAFAQLTTPPVTVNTNGVLLFPTNFFSANSNALVAVTGTGAGSSAGKLDANGGTATNTTLTGTTAFTGPITSASTITLSSQRIIGVANPSGSSDAANKLYVDGKFANTALTGTTTADLIQATLLQSSQVANTNKLAYFDADGVLTNAGFSTNALRFIERVVPHVNDLVSVNPALFLAEGGGTIAYFTTVSNGVAGAAQQHWMWDPTMTGGTNFAYAGGPLAWPYGSSTGRWFEIKPYTAVASRVMTLAPLYPDAADGTTNTNDPTSYINGVYAAAEAAYTTQLGSVTVDHPPGTYTVNELFIRGRVTYNFDGFTRFKKRSHPFGTTNRSIASTIRLGFCNIDTTDGSFIDWGDAGGTNGYYAAADNWYGKSDGITFTGHGKVVYDQNQKDCTQPLLRLFEVRDFRVENGVIEVWHNASTNTPTATDSWAISLIGRNVHWYSPIIRGGTKTTQDGMHICAGRDIWIFNGYGQSGDDSLVCEAEMAGAFTNPADEPLERVHIIGWHAEARRGRAACILVGPNWINVPYTNRAVEFRGITIDGVTGTAAVERTYGLGIGNFPDGGGIYNYTITDQGTGYSDGYYTVGVGAVGGGSGAQCTLKVVGGKVVRAVMAKVSGTWRPGTGYTQSQAVTVASIPGGSGALITGNLYGVPNDKIEDCVIKNFNLDIGSTTHDGTEPIGIKFSGATDCTIGPGYLRITDNTDNLTYPTNAFRPYYVNGSSNCVVRNVVISPTYRGGAIDNQNLPNAFVTGITFDKCTIGPQQNAGNGICKIQGNTIGRVSFKDSTLNVASGTACFYIPDTESGRTYRSDLLEVDHCTIIAPSGASNTRAIDFVPNGGSGNMLGKLIFKDNTLVNITTEDTQAVIQAACTQYDIDGNSGGYRTKLAAVVTQSSGTAQVTANVSTTTGLIGNTTASLPCVRVVPLGNPGTNWWIEPSTTGAFLIKTAGNVAANLDWAVYVDTSRKPLTGY